MIDQNAKHLAKSDRIVSTLEQEGSRYQFTYEHTSKKGQWLQWFLKQTIIKTVHFIHNQIKGKYDKNAYVFQDPRLHMIHDFVSMYARDNMEARKQNIVNEAMDIFLFLLKEDIFYRVRVVDAIRLWCHLYPNMKWQGEPLFGLDEPEQENLKIWKGK